MEADCKSSAFEALPKEIRYEIYRYLLKTSHTFVSNAPEQRYRMHPAILRTNKTISAEARVVMEENDFVVILVYPEVDRYGRRADSWVRNVPRFKGSAAQTDIRQALTISIGCTDSMMKSDALGPTVIVTGPESLDSLVESFRGYLGPTLQSPRHRTPTRLHLDTKSCRRAVALLRPFLQIHNYKMISITGTVDQNYARDVVSHIGCLFPSCDFVKAVVNEHVTLAEEAYRQGLYYLASHQWSRATQYCGIMRYDTSSDYTGCTELGDIIDLTSPTMLRARLGIGKACLRSEEFSKALLECQSVIGYIPGIHLDLFMEAQFLLCAWIAYILGDEYTCTWIHDIHRTVFIRLDTEHFTAGMMAFREALTEVVAIANVYGAISCQTFERYLTLIERNDSSGGNGNETTRKVGNDQQ